MFLKKIKYPFAFIKALKMDEQKKYGKTIEILEPYKDFIENNKDNFPDYYILLGEAYARLGKHLISQKEFEVALNILSGTSLLNQDERAYLKKYIYNWLKYLALNYNHSLAIEEYKKNINNLFYNEAKIRHSFKINFSQDIHNN